MNKAIASPSVRALAARRGIDLNSLAAQLGRETVAREDIEDSPEMTARPGGGAYWDVDHAAFGPVVEEPLPRMAKVAAANLAASNMMIPAVTHHDEADSSAIEALRAKLEPDFSESGVKLTALAFHVAVLAKCLRKHPRFNASISSDGNTLIFKQYFHIGIAVDTEFGLVVPVIRNAGCKGLFEIASNISDLASRARKRKLRPEEMGGASMTITNLGGIGGTAFTPIVNPPEVAILGITRSRIVPVWDGKAFQPTRMVPLDLSYDHRVINGAEAARFMTDYAGTFGNPRRLLL